MAKRKPRRPTRTLFDPDYRGHGGVFRQLPYYLAVRSLADESDDRRFPEYEPAIFDHCLDHDVHLSEARGRIAGPLTWKLAGQRAADLSKSPQPVPIPAFVEYDAIELRRCATRGLLLIEDNWIFDQLAEHRAWASLDLVLATGSGLPRFALRRLLHRFSVELKKPIFLLTDNDTWGYFIFSLLKRGTVGPHAASPYLGVKDLRLLGLRAGAAESLATSCTMRPWKPEWDLRLAHLRQYPCFARAAWQRELDRFEKQKGAIDLRAYYNVLGEQQFVHDLCEKLWRTEWLR